jgi:HD domain
MRDAIAYLTSLAQALARMGLYADGHPARQRAADASLTCLRSLQAEHPQVTFSFLGDVVLFGETPIRELQGWDWGRKLSVVGVQRLEFHEAVAPGEYRAFLDSLLPRLSRGRALDVGHLDARTPVGGSEWIRFGAVGMRDLQAPGRATPGDSRGVAGEPVDLSDEAAAVAWLHDEILEGRDVALHEAEIVVHSLAASIHAGQRMLVPLLQLKEFDQYTTTHALNVAVLSMALAERLGLSSREILQYGMAGLLHDLGKVKVPVEILRKPGALSAVELATMRQHPAEGARLILARDDRLDLCATVAFEHHIMIDGGGYPTRMRRCDCHHASMLVHVCDVYDALRTNRPYRVAWEAGVITSYIEGRIGQEFEPTVARAFLDMIGDADVTPARADIIDDLVTQAG